jgi:hypothetical protein
MRSALRVDRAEQALNIVGEQEAVGADAVDSAGAARFVRFRLMQCADGAG